MLKLKEYIDADQDPISESFVGKTYAITQNRQHASNRNKLTSALSRLKSVAERGISQDEIEKRFELLFRALIELANALKAQSEMARNEINVSTAGVLDTQNIRKELQRSVRARR